MRGWQELAAIALEGTAKTEGGADAPRQLLREAAWHAVTRLAGHKADAVSSGAVPAAPAESQPLVGVAAATRLEEILRSDDREHLGEWLLLAAGAGKRVPPSLLPPLLERGAEKSDIRTSILACGGARVSWLAAQNEEWAYAAIVDPHEAFTSGIRAARVAALGALRRQDPAAALALLTGGWSSEGGDDRAALISVLAIALGPGDEQFLSDATTDGRKEVRTTAADLLASLPTSALIARMVARADSWISFKKGLLGAKLDITPPAECSADMVADGIEPKAPKGVGERAHWLRQVVALVPPSHWTTDILQPGLKSEWADALLAGWTDATVRFRDPAWCQLLIDHYAAVKERWKVQAQLTSLVKAMPAASLEGLVERELAKAPHVGLELAVLSGQKLSATLSRRLVGTLQLDVRPVQKQQDYWLVQSARSLKAQLDPSVLPDAIAAADRALTVGAAPAAEAFQALAAALEYRAEMAKEIAN